VNPSEPTLIIFHGGLGLGPAERIMAAARVVAAKHTAQAALDGGFDGVIIATDSPCDFANASSGITVDADAPGAFFDFSARLKGIVARYDLGRPAVLGSGSLPFLTSTDWRGIASSLRRQDNFFVTNNFFSSDFTAWTPGSAIEATRELTRDNVLPRRLRDDAALAPTTLPRTTATQFDMDTPVDLAVLGLQENLSPELARVARPVSNLSERLRVVMPILCNREGHLVVAGRVGSSAWQYLERDTACRVRLYSEERSLASAPAGYVARSALGFLLEAVGFDGFFQRMAELGDALILDTRVLEAHAGVTPSREDRFRSDLFNWQMIENPWLEALTRAASEARKPVLLGGHSLVSGGLMALNDVAWAENDQKVAQAKVNET
jgi:hypothetical protein